MRGIIKATKGVSTISESDGEGSIHPVLIIAFVVFVVFCIYVLFFSESKNK